MKTTDGNGEAEVQAIYENQIGLTSWFVHQGPFNWELSTETPVLTMAMKGLRKGDVVEFVFSATGFGNFGYYTAKGDEGFPLTLLARGRRSVRCPPDQLATLHATTLYLADEDCPESGWNFVVRAVQISENPPLPNRIHLLGYSLVGRVLNRM